MTSLLHLSSSPPPSFLRAGEGVVLFWKERVPLLWGPAGWPGGGWGGGGEGEGGRSRKRGTRRSEFFPVDLSHMRRHMLLPFPHRAFSQLTTHQGR